MLRKLLFTVGTFGALSLGALAAPALAISNPPPVDITATATVEQSLTVTGVDTAVSFPTGAPSQTVTAPAAETFDVAAYVPNGATVSLQNGNDGFTYAPGAPTIIRNDQVAVATESFGTVNLTPLPGNYTPLENVAVGEHSYSHDWSLSIPSTVTYTGALTAHYTLAVTAN